MSWRKLRVMVSSTVEDLVDERRVVDEIIQVFEFERFRSESMVALSRSPREVCEAMAKDCDVQILIIGRRYGWIVPELGISVTEREYDIARQQDSGKVLVFVQELPVQKREPLAQVFLQKATDFSTGLFRAKPFSSSHESAEQVKSAMSVWLSERILQRGLSPKVISGLPTNAEARKTLISIVVITVCLLLFPTVLGMLGISTYFVPSTRELLLEWKRDSALFGFSALATLLRAILAWGIGLIGGVGAAGSIIVMSPRSARMYTFAVTTLTIVTGVLAFAELFGSTTFGLYAGSATVATLVVNSLSHHFLSVGVPSTFKAAVDKTLDRLLSTESTAALLPISIAIEFVSEWFGDRSGLGNLFFKGRMIGEPTYSWSAISIFVIAIFAAYAVSRAIQARIGWSVIIWPRILAKHSLQAGGD